LADIKPLFRLKGESGDIARTRLEGRELPIPFFGVVQNHGCLPALLPDFEVNGVRLS
jgi:hypothetical protein